jgi:hypothetical protein
LRGGLTELTEFRQEEHEGHEERQRGFLTGLTRFTGLGGKAWFRTEDCKGLKRGKAGGVFDGIKMINGIGGRRIDRPNCQIFQITKLKAWEFDEIME